VLNEQHLKQYSILDFAFAQDFAENVSTFGALVEADFQLHAFASFIWAARHFPCLLWFCYFSSAFLTFCHFFVFLRIIALMPFV
jgi:hypothetical protein